MKFRPTRRTQILMAGVVLAGVVGGFVLWRNAERVAQQRAAAQASTVPERPAVVTPNMGRANTQLTQRLGQHQLVYAMEAGPAVCGYVAARGAAAAQRGVQRVNAFVSLPDRLVLANDDPAFEALLASSCPNLPGARRPAGR